MRCCERYMLSTKTMLVAPEYKVRSRCVTSLKCICMYVVGLVLDVSRSIKKQN